LESVKKKTYVARWKEGIADIYGRGMWMSMVQMYKIGGREDLKI
jgi:hypothetical protein